MIASINMTFDGFCDHTAAIANAELHDFYTDMLRNAGIILSGRTTYKLMEDFWPTVVKKPTGDKHLNDFAKAIDNVQKVLFSNTIKSVTWNNTRLATKSLKDEVTELKKQPGKDIFIGSPSLIAQLTRLNLVDVWQICVHPVIAGHGLPLFKGITDRIILKLLKTQTFKTSDHIVFFYAPGKE
ncbi:MAG TPA: dihydrofolate reductase family protein [Cyclobacteriaceae bacterium]|nr:dihydrofolate reductase family protein [Cyclobacteriaceae bacterium]